MAQFVTHYNERGVSGWPSNPDNMVDGDDGTYAVSAGWDDPSVQFCFFSGGTFPTTNDIISKVEVRVKGSRSTFESYVNLELELAALPLGTGDSYDLIPLLTGSIAYTSWIDVTDSWNGGTYTPGGVWTWDMLGNSAINFFSDIACNGIYPACSPFAFTRCSIIEMRVTYEPASKIIIRDTLENVIGQYDYFEDELNAVGGQLTPFIFPLTYVGQDIGRVEVIGQSNYALKSIQFGDKFPDVSPEDHDTRETGSVGQEAKEDGFGGAAAGRYSADFDDDADANIIVTSSPLFAFAPGDDFIFSLDIKWNAFSGFQKYSLMYNWFNADNYWMFTFNTHGSPTGGAVFFRLREGGITRISNEPPGPTPVIDYELGQWYNLAVMRKAGLFYFHRDGKPLGTNPIVNNSDFPQWSDIKVGATLVDHYTHTWVGEDFELDNVKIYDKTQTFDPAGYDWWTGQYFDDSRWEILGPNGYWDENGWHSTDTPAPFWGIRMITIGSWYLGFRPTKIRFTWEEPGTLFIGVYDRVFSELIVYQNPVESGDALELDWSGAGDGFDISMGSNNAPFKLTNIEFVP